MHPTFSQNLWIGLIFTGVSLTRSYLLRRGFEALRMRQAARQACADLILSTGSSSAEGPDRKAGTPRICRCAVALGSSHSKADRDGCTTHVDVGFNQRRPASAAGDCGCRRYRSEDERQGLHQTLSHLFKAPPSDEALPWQSSGLLFSENGQRSPSMPVGTALVRHNPLRTPELPGDQQSAQSRSDAIRQHHIPGGPSFVSENEDRDSRVGYHFFPIGCPSSLSLLRVGDRVGERPKG